MRQIKRVGILALMLAVLLAPPAWGASNTLSWTDNSTNETAFDIERKAEACAGTLPFVILATVGANVATYTDNAVTEGVTYCYRVDASNSAGKSAYSNTASRTVPFTVPTPPSSLTVN